MAKEKISLGFRLKKIYETKNYLLKVVNIILYLVKSIKKSAVP